MKYIIALSAILLSCSLFEPRTPEDPSQGGVVWLTPTNPDIVVENMVSALNGRSVLYLDCLIEDFVFIADTSDVDDNPILNFTDWTKGVENLTVTQLYSAVPEDSSITAEFTTLNEYPDPTAPEDSATIYREYLIHIPGAKYSPAYGIAELHMIQDEEGLWRVSRWNDSRYIQSQAVKTWGVVKAVYR